VWFEVLLFSGYVIPVSYVMAGFQGREDVFDCDVEIGRSGQGG
jgi:hypothetical protein